ncbi:hypothetical protein PWT90_10443 [Aphanocladium album]|nr:hypothetical protein PWT90_10443 [Aphanocladium album]
MESMANKVLRMKMWEDENGGTWKKNVTDISGEVLCVSQFTLLANTKKGTKPDFHGALNPEDARRLYQHFVERVKAGYQADRVKDGKFQAMMEVALVNDGPVTLELNVGGKATPEKVAPEKVAPGKAAPGKAAPRKAAPGKAAPGKAAPGKAAPGKAVPGKAAPEEAEKEH